MEAKKVLVPTIIAIVTLVAITVGATYAYFSVEVNNNFGTTQVGTATTGEIGSVAFNKASDATLALNVTAMQMLEQTADTTYYATNSATPKTIGTINVTGAGTYSCTYSITVTQANAAGATNNLYTKFQAMTGKSAGQVYFTINEKTFDFNTANLFNGTNNVYTKTVTGLTESNPATVTSNIAIVNKKTVDQTSLNDSGITLSYEVTSFTCSLTAN